MAEVRRAFFAALDAAIAMTFLVVGLVVLAATLYAIKRSLGIDIVPGVDMLPDDLIEAILGL